jgi:uncharacterized membrane protein YdjX (TVP38/TMEM64 family)
MTRHGIHEHRRIIEAVALLIVLVAMAASDPVHDFAQRLIEATAVVIQNHPLLGAFVFSALAAVSAMFVFFSSAIIVPVGTEVWGRPLTIVLLGLGWLGGGALSYIVGRYPGRRLLRWLVPKTPMRRYEEMLAADRNFALVALFQLAVPSEVPGYLLGTMRYPFGRYFLVLAIGEIPYAIGATYMADSFLHRQYTWLIGLGLAAIAVSTTAAVLLRRKMAASRSRSPSESLLHFHDGDRQHDREGERDPVRAGGDLQLQDFPQGTEGHSENLESDDSGAGVPDVRIAEQALERGMRP